MAAPGPGTDWPLRPSSSSNDQPGTDTDEAGQLSPALPSPARENLRLSYDLNDPSLSPVPNRGHDSITDSDHFGSTYRHSRCFSTTTSERPLRQADSMYERPLSFNADEPEQQLDVPELAHVKEETAHVKEETAHVKDETITRSRFSLDNERFSVLSDILLMYSPGLSRLASNSSQESHYMKNREKRLQVLTPISEQRHPGKAGARLSRHTVPWEPSVDENHDADRVDKSLRDALEKSENNEVKGLSLALLITGLSLVVFLISIDRTIITTAIPYITAEFHSTPDIGWYGSAYLLTACAFQPVFGRVFTLFHIKWSYMLAMFMFLLGSLISGVAPSSMTLIIGRAVAGFGSAGILTGSFVIVATGVPLKARPIYTSIVGLMFGVGATVGPLIGGVFTDLATWRWCFYINLPAGALTLVVMALVFHPAPQNHLHRPFFDRLIDLDIIGNFILLAMSVMLFLALEFTTTGEPWSSAKTVGLLCGFGAGILAFVTWQWWKQDGALIPPSIVMQRTVSAACLAGFFTYGALLIHTYFMPIWFQAVWGFTAIQSGVAMIPYFVANALFSLFSGIFVSKVGYFTPPAILGSAIGTVGCGMVTLFHPGMSTGMWIGFQILASAGFGMSIQQGFTAVQTVLSKEDVAVGTASVVAAQSLGGAVFISVGNNVFQASLRSIVAADKLDGIDVDAVIAAGATAFRHLVPTGELTELILDYNRALQTVFLVAVPLAGLAWFSCCCLEWNSVKGKPPTSTTEASEKGRS
ncbi:major facilitator superfamily transporter [Apiospora phragmitis]|uniref:Major facilitator superfamily transporter n=1 Tax=Apiospora phragmitis TaxID=2905665 RepID=A0ABR1UTQ0_9PEZI